MASKNQTPTYITREHKWTNNRKDQVWEDRRYRMGTTPAIEFGATLNDPIGQPYSNKSKSKDRYREMQAGGDIQLSSDSFQVKGNPQVTDGNTYPQLNAKLDHNEVVSTTQDGNKFIFSNTLKLGKKSFAEIVKPIERAKGKAEKLLMVTPGDRISKNTVALSNKLLDDVANQQEQLAVAKGHRNSDGSTKQPGQYATGGPIYPEKDKPFMSTNDPSIFYNPYNNSYYKRQSNGSYSEYSADRLPYIDDSAIQSHLQRYPGKTEQPPINTLSQFNEANMSGMYNSQESSLLDQVGQPLDSRNSVSKSPSKRKAPIVKKTALARTSVPLPPGVSTHYNPANRNAEMTVLPDGSVVPSNIISDTSTPYNSQGTADQRAAVIEKVPFLWDSDKDAINKPWKTDEGYQAGLTGDTNPLLSKDTTDHYQTP